MRITHTTLRYPPASGGVEDYVQNLVEGLRAEGDDVDVETTSLRTHHPATFLAAGLLKADPSYVHRHPVRTLGPVAYPLPVSLSSTLARSPASTLVHAHGFWYAPADMAARAARLRRTPFVLNPYYSPRTKLLWTAYRSLIGNRTVAAADAVVVISPQEETALRADGFVLGRVALIPPGIETREFDHQRPDPFVQRGLREKQVLLFAGRITVAKGLDLLLAALPTILRVTQEDDRDVHLAIAGEDFGERSALESLAERLGISHAITWLGKLSREELVAAYQHAAAFVFPSRYEAFGIAPLEAQAAGCPVVATNTASLPFVVQHEETGLLFRPEDPHDLAAKVVYLLRDHERSRRLAAAGRERAHRTFRWDRSVEKLRTLYTELLGAFTDRT